MKHTEDILGEYGYRVTYTVEGHVVHFQAVRIEGRYVGTSEPHLSDEVAILGDLKWDGCLNVLYDGGNWAHYCDPQDLIRQAECLKHCYSKARELGAFDIPEFPQC